MQGAWVQSLVREVDPTSHKYRSRMLQQGTEKACAAANTAQSNKLTTTTKKIKAVTVVSRRVKGIEGGQRRFCA